MNKKIFNIFNNITLLIISILIFIGCSAPINNSEISEMLDGMPYSYYKTFQYNNNEYKIYAIDIEEIDILNGTIIYVYERYDKNNIKENINTWTINYITTNQYYIYNRYNKPSNDIINEFKNQINDKLNEYEQKLTINFQVYNNLETVEKEFTINNLGMYDNIYVIDMYIPFALNINNSSDLITILLPVSTFICYEQQDNMQFVYNNNVIKNINAYELQNKKFFTTIEKLK